MKNACALILIVLLGPCSRAFANTEELVASIYHGGNPFMVVTKDDEGGSRRLPGIYGRAQENWRQIIAGDVLHDERKGLWIKQLKLSQKDELYHTMLVIDGSLYLINLGSDASKTGSLLKIGSPEFPLNEVLTGQKRTLPRIGSVDDISFLALEDDSNKDFQLVLVSIKCDSPSGNGITFAIGLQPMGKDQTSYAIKGKPWVLDYQFYQQTDLAKLATFDNAQKTYQLHSGIATDFLANIDTSVFRDHKNIVDETLKQLIAKNTKGGIPAATVELGSGQLTKSLDPAKSFKFADQQFTFNQQYSLRTQSYKLTVANGTDSTHNMLLNFNGPNSPAIFGSSSPAASIFVADDKLFLMFKDTRLNLVELGPSLPYTGSYQLSDALVDLADAKDGIKRKILFLSQVNEDGSGKVFAYKLAFYSTGAIIAEDRVQVLDKGIKPFELPTRMVNVDNDILFDALTPPCATIEEYKQIHDTSRPYVNVSKSTAAKLTYTFAEPLQKLESGSGFTYRVYAPSNLIENPTGLYGTIRNHGAQGRSLGQLLTRGQRKEDENEPPAKISFLADFSAIKFDAADSLSLKIVALDSTFKNGQTSFKLVVAIDSNGGNFDTQFVEFNLGFPFENLIAVRAYPGRKSHDKEIALILSYEKMVNDKPQGFTTALVIQGSQDKGQLTFKANSNTEAVLAKEALEPAQLKERFLYDEDGRIHFIVDPKVPKEERRFEIFNIFTNSPAKPNVDKGYKLLWDSKDSGEGEAYDDRKVPWRLPPVDLERRFTFIAKRSRDAEASYLWGNLFSLLDTMSQEKTSDKIRVLIVPPDMKKYVNELIITRYGRFKSERSDSPFFWRNRNLRFYQFDPDSASQDDILDNLEAIQKFGNGSNFILADMAHITRVNRPPAKSFNFHIKKLIGGDGVAFGEDASAQEEMELPHALYLLAAGDTTQPDELMKHRQRSYSSLIVSTPEEWKEAQAQAENEMEAGLDSFFTTIELPLPTAEDRAQLLNQVFEDKNIAFLRLQFDAKGIAKNVGDTPQAQQTKLLEYAVMRVASEAENAKQDGLTAFVSFRNQFIQQLLKDRTIRRSRVVDKAFVERVLTSVFDIPVNLESLPPDDPIFILSRKDAVRQLSDRGVEGPFAIKARVIKTMLSVLKFDPTRSIPSSHILIGESGSGKTRMVTGLLDWLFPIRYDFNNPSKNGEAQSIRINVGKLVETRKDSGGGDQLTFEEVRDHINNFLINGFRGAIFLDDFHAAPDKVRTELLGFLRTLLESQGLYNASSPYSVNSAMVPLRHLHLFIALNPTENQALIDTFRKDKTQPATFEEVLMASLSTKDYKVERSLLKRIGAIHNLMKFPHGAKAPALSKDTLLTARDIMLRKQKLIINWAGAIRLVSDAFPNMDARTFLSTASSGLVDQVDPQLFPHGTLFHVIPGRRRTFGGSFSGDSYDESEKGRVEDFIQRSTKVMPLTDASPESQLYFIRTLARNFRLPLLEQFLISLEDDERFSESIENQRNFLLPSMMAMRNHLLQNSELPLGLLNLDPSGFGLKTSGDRALFKDLMAEVSDGRDVSKYFPFPISRNEGVGGWDILITGTTEGVPKSRTTMITRYYQKVSEILQRYAKKYYYLDSLEGMPDPEKWLRQLPQQTNETNLRPNIDELRELFWTFISDINDPTLRDRSEQGDGHLTPYAIARIYYYLIDKAVTDLPWIQINKHMIRSLDQVVQDQVLGQSPGVKSYFFEYKYSPIRAASPELIQQLVESSQLSSEYPDLSQMNIHNDYQEYCEKLLGGVK